MDVIQMQHARILLVHTHVNAKVDLVVMELTAQVCHLVLSGGISPGRTIEKRLQSLKSFFYRFRNKPIEKICNRHNIIKLIFFCKSNKFSIRSYSALHDWNNTLNDIP